MSDTRPVIAILGGTGDLGSGLARRWAAAGYELIVGSRSPGKAVAAARDLNDRVGREAARGLGNAEAAAAADIAVLTVPFAHHQAILEDVIK